MPQTPSDAIRRELVVTAGNIRNNHVYISGNYDFFPEDCIGPPRRSNTTDSRQIAIHLDGLGQTTHTDIGVNRNGKPRGHFRNRAWVRPFFQHHRIAAGDRLLLERITEKCRRCGFAF